MMRRGTSSQERSELVLAPVVRGLVGPHAERGHTHPDILKYPRPDVIFMDHGDSALIFRLRIWTHVDYYWSVTSAIRFELDKRFRELNIEIAFPQRDIHIRGMTNTEETKVKLDNASG